MRIVLLKCPWITILHPPDIGVAYIIASMKNSGHEVSYIDLNAEFYSKIDQTDKSQLIYSSAAVLMREGEKVFSNHQVLTEEAIERVLRLKPDIVGFNVWQMNREVSLEFASRIRKAAPDVKIIFGGPEMYPLLSGNKYAAEKTIDLVVYGEAEKTLARALDGLQATGKFPLLPGTILRVEGKILDGGFGEVPQDLDELPLPALEDLSLDLYVNADIPISFTRGCVHKCEYCPCRMYPHFRSRSSGSILSEIEYRINSLPGRNKFFVCDHELNANIGVLSEICEELIKRGINATFSGFAYTHPGADIDYLRKMKKAGFNEVTYGVESGSDKILSVLGKKIGINVIERVIKDTFDAGIDTCMDILVGLPGETEQDFRETQEFIKRNSRYVKKVGVNQFGVLAYSEIYESMEKYDLLPVSVVMERIERLLGMLENLALPETIKAR